MVSIISGRVTAAESGWHAEAVADVLERVGAREAGLTDAEAQEFHTYYIQGYLLWAAGAFFAHSLVWIWRPWF